MMYLDFAPEHEAFPAAVARGLRQLPKRISPKYFYDERGSELFEKICDQPEYYPTRTETLILHRNVREIAEAIRGDMTLIEFGSGASVKTRILLDHAKVRRYIPLDISKSFLLKTAEMLQALYPEIEIIPACGDFTANMKIPPYVLSDSGSRIGFLPGSTLGNFDPIDAARILKSIRSVLGGGHLLIGIDLMKEPAVLEAAYNDAAGVTAEFNRNLIYRLRQELGAELDPGDFEHRAFYNEKLGRVEMHLVARKSRRFEISGESFLVEEGELIHTESSYKYRPAVFERLCQDCGFDLVRSWTDPNEWFGVFLLEARAPEALAARAA